MMPLPYDFYHLWASARVARLGGNPYAPEQITPLMLESGWPPAEAVTGFMHPFWSLPLLTPLSYLPFPLAAVVWELSIVLLVVVSIRLFLNDAVRTQVGESPILLSKTSRKLMPNPSPLNPSSNFFR